MMDNQDAMRRILQLERMVRDLQSELARSRAKQHSAAGDISRIAILQAVSAIGGRTDNGDGTYDISHGTARIFDLIVRDTTDPWVLSPVKAGATDRTVELGNLWSGQIAADAFLLGNSYSNVYLHGAEECD